jgi:hypothetical protein
MRTHDRRRFPRVETEIAVKCRRTARSAYTLGRTIDLSPSGVLLELHSSTPATVGDRIALAFDCPQCPVTKSAHMVTATIVRTVAVDETRQRIAVHFDTPQFGLEALDYQAAA